MATVDLKVKIKKEGKGFNNVGITLRKNAAILPSITAANIAHIAAEMAPVWHGTVNPGKGRVVGWPGHRHRLTPMAHSYPIPGHLRDSIHSSGSTVYVDAYYGIYVEFGTRFMHQEPFLRPACILVNKAQFQPDVARMLISDVGQAGNDLDVYAASTGVIAYHHAKHVEAKYRNKTRSVAQRRYEVNRRFTAMRTRGLHQGGIVTRI